MKRTVEEYQEYRRAIVREAQRKRRQRAQETGLCICCVKNKPDAGYKTCRACRMRVTEYNRTHSRMKGEQHAK